MKKCECSHPSSFHTDIEQKKKGGMEKFADNLGGVFGGSGENRVCLGELKSGKPCPCRRYTEEE